jgi:hypothetical protein
MHLPMIFVISRKITSRKVNDFKQALLKDFKTKKGDLNFLSLLVPNKISFGELNNSITNIIYVTMSLVT